MIERELRSKAAIHVLAAAFAVAAVVCGAARADTLTPEAADGLSQAFDGTADTLQSGAEQVKEAVSDTLRERDPDVADKFDEAMDNAENLDEQVETVEDRLRAEAGLDDGDPIPDSLDPDDRPDGGREQEVFDNLRTQMKVRSDLSRIWALRELLKLVRQFREMAEVYGEYGGRAATGTTPISRAVTPNQYRGEGALAQADPLNSFAGMKIDHIAQWRWGNQDGDGFMPAGIGDRLEYMNRLGHVRGYGESLLGAADHLSTVNSNNLSFDAEGLDVSRMRFADLTSIMGFNLAWGPELEGTVRGADGMKQLTNANTGQPAPGKTITLASNSEVTNQPVKPDDEYPAGTEFRHYNPEFHVGITYTFGGSGGAPPTSPSQELPPTTDTEPPEEEEEPNRPPYTDGNDQLSGTTGPDELTGGDGDDEYFFHVERDLDDGDRITDYESGEAIIIEGDLIKGSQIDVEYDEDKDETTVQLDTDEDGEPDKTLVLDGDQRGEIEVNQNCCGVEMTEIRIRKRTETAEEQPQTPGAEQDEDSGSTPRDGGQGAVPDDADGDIRVTPRPQEFWIGSEEHVERAEDKVASEVDVFTGSMGGISVGVGGYLDTYFGVAERNTVSELPPPADKSEAELGTVIRIDYSWSDGSTVLFGYPYAGDQRLDSAEHSVDNGSMRYMTPHFEGFNPALANGFDSNFEYARDTHIAPFAAGDPHFVGKGSWGQDYDDQWALKAVGLDAEAHRTLFPDEATPITVAVLDTGVDMFHPELVGATWVNADEIPNNGVDDDGNGFADDVYGWNFVDGDYDTRDRNGHGTAVAGIVAAWAGNERGIAGVNPWARIMPVKIADDLGNGSTIRIAKGIQYAADNGARVINISSEGDVWSRAVYRAALYARKRGAIVVAAAGNEGKEVEAITPAGIPTVITVAASDTRGERAPFSNWGPNVEIAAPGVDVLTLRADGTDFLRFERDDYQPGSAFVGQGNALYRVTGSSFAAPFVSGVASLIWSLDPDLTPGQVKRKLLHSAKDIGTPGFDNYTGFGLLDAAAALDADPRDFLITRLWDAAIKQGDQGIYLEALGTATADDFKRAWVEIGQGESPQSWTRASEDIVAPVDNDVLTKVSVAPITGAGVWTLRLRLEDKSGDQTEARFSLTVN